MGWFERWNADKCKATLKVAAGRTKLLRPKLETSAKKHKREIAQLLTNGKTPLAKIRAEQVLQDLRMEAAYEILGIHAELLATRMGYIDSEKECPRDLMTAVCTVLYAQSRMDVPELTDVKRQFELKYGKEWVKIAAEDSMELAHQTLIEYLSVEPPKPTEISGMLGQVALENGIEWTDPDPPADYRPPVKQAAPEAGEDLEARLAALRSDGVKVGTAAAPSAATAAPAAPPAEDPEVAKMKAQLAALEAQLEKERQANQANQAASASQPPAAPLPPPSAPAAPGPSAATDELSLEARLAALTGGAAPSSAPSNRFETMPDPQAQGKGGGGGYAATSGASQPGTSMVPPPPAPGASMAPPPPAGGASMASPPGDSMAPPPAAASVPPPGDAGDSLEARLAALRGDAPSQKPSASVPSGTIVMPAGGTIVADSMPPPPAGQDPEAVKMAARLAELEAEIARSQQKQPTVPPAPSDSQSNPFSSFVEPPPPSNPDDLPPPPPPPGDGGTTFAEDPEMEALRKRFAGLQK